MITQLAHVCIGATDLDASRKFYCDTLGFHKVFDFIQDGSVIGYYLEVSNHTFIEVFRQGPGAPAEGLIRHLCFEVADIDEVGLKLVQDGCRVTDKKLGADNSWQIWTADPSGVRIEFHQYTEDSSQRTQRDCILG